MRKRGQKLVFGAIRGFRFTARHLLAYQHLSAFFFRAHQPTLNRVVVLEVFDPPMTSRPGFRDALLEEVRRASKFLHPSSKCLELSRGPARGKRFLRSGDRVQPRLRPLVRYGHLVEPGREPLLAIPEVAAPPKEDDAGC